MATIDDLVNLVPGSKVIISKCEARAHDNGAGCVCGLMGTMQTVGKRKESMFAGTPSWWLVGMDKSVRLSEITFVREE